MPRLAPAVSVLAATAALAVLPLTATTASAASASHASAPGALGACAELTDQGAGWASLRNDCGVEVSGSVQLSSGTNPECVPIAAKGTATVRWTGAGTAEYAYDC